MRIIIKSILVILVIIFYACSSDMTDIPTEDDINPVDSIETMLLGGTILYQNDTLGSLQYDINGDSLVDFTFFIWYASSSIFTSERLILMGNHENALINGEKIDYTVYTKRDTALFESNGYFPYILRDTTTRSCIELFGENVTSSLFNEHSIFYKDSSDTELAPETDWLGSYFDLPLFFSEGWEFYDVCGDTAKYHHYLDEVDCYAPDLGETIFFHIKVDAVDKTYHARVRFERTPEDRFVVHEIFLFD